MKSTRDVQLTEFHSGLDAVKRELGRIWLTRRLSIEIDELDNNSLLEYSSYW